MLTNCLLRLRLPFIITASPVAVGRYDILAEHIACLGHWKVHSGICYQTKGGFVLR